MQNGRGSGIEGNWQLHNFISLLAHSLFIRWLCAHIRKALVSAKLSTKPAWYFPFTGRKSPWAVLDAVEKHSAHIILYNFESTRSAWEMGTSRLQHPSFPPLPNSMVLRNSRQGLSLTPHQDLSVKIHLQSSSSSPFKRNSSFLKPPPKL